MSDTQPIRITKLSQIKEMAPDIAWGDGYKEAQMFGDIKKIYASRSSYDGKGGEKMGSVAIFYKRCKPFGWLKDTVQMQMFTFTIEPACDEGMDDKLKLDLWSEFHGEDSRWQAKEEEKMSDKDFFDYYKRP